MFWFYIGDLGGLENFDQKLKFLGFFQLRSPLNKQCPSDDVYLCVGSLDTFSSKRRSYISSVLWKTWTLGQQVWFLPFKKLSLLSQCSGSSQYRWHSAPSCFWVQECIVWFLVNILFRKVPWLSLWLGRIHVLHIHVWNTRHGVTHFRNSR